MSAVEATGVVWLATDVRNPIGAAMRVVAARWPSPATESEASRFLRLAGAFIDALIASNLYLLSSALVVATFFKPIDLLSVVDGIISITFLLFPLCYAIWSTIWVVYGLASEAFWGRTLGFYAVGLRGEAADHRLLRFLLKTCSNMPTYFYSSG